LAPLHIIHGAELWQKTLDLSTSNVDTASRSVSAENKPNGAIFAPALATKMTLPMATPSAPSALPIVQFVIAPSTKTRAPA